MARATYRVHLVTHHDGRMTGRLLSAQGATREEITGYGSSEDEIFHQLALALEEVEGGTQRYLWSEALQVRKVEVEVHPQTIVKKRHVIAREKIALQLAYAWSKLEAGGYRVLVPRFGWWFVLEDMDMAPEIIKQSVSNAMLGERSRSLFEFRALREEQVVEWSPTLSRRPEHRPGFAEGERFPTLHSVAEELVERARRGGRRRKPIVGEVELEPHLPHLLREQPRSLLLVGPPGVGKSTWVRALARQLSKLDAREYPAIPRIWSTSADRIVSGMSYLGMWEQRCLDLADELSGEGDLLYVDHIMPLLAPRTGHSSIADMFMPFLEAGEMALLAEATEVELERLSSRHPGLANLFHVVKLRPTATQAMPALLAEYQARIDGRTAIEPEALRRLVQHLEFFQRDSGFPGKGFRFLDWFAQEHGDANVSGAGIVFAEEAEATPPARTIDGPTMSRAFARSSGLPLELISEDHVAGPEHVAARLAAGVIGQDGACATAARVLTRFKAGLNDPQRPLGSLFFVGPTGVGKTELAKQIARYMFGDADRMVRLDMSEYMLPGSGGRLLAVGKGVRSLVEQVRQRPLSLVLLDEIEKAHAEVFDLLLAMLGEGRMTDTEGRLVDFRMTIVVMTSNLGVRAGSGVGFGGGRQTGKDLLGAVRQHFRPEFFNRIDHVVPFNALGPDDILRVVDLEIVKAQRRAGFERRELVLEVDVSAREALARLGYHPSHGARPLKRVIEERLVSPLAVQMAAEPALRQRKIHVTANEARAAELEARGELVVQVRG